MLSSFSIWELCMLSSFSHIQLFATLWTMARQAPLSVRFFRQEYWQGLPCPPPRDLPDPGIEPATLRSPALAGWFFTTSATWEAQDLFILTMHHSIRILVLWPGIKPMPPGVETWDLDCQGNHWTAMGTVFHSFLWPQCLSDSWTHHRCSGDVYGVIEMNTARHLEVNSRERKTMLSLTRVLSL